MVVVLALIWNLLSVIPTWKIPPEVSSGGASGTTLGPRTNTKSEKGILTLPNPVVEEVAGILYSAWYTISPRLVESVRTDAFQTRRSGSSSEARRRSRKIPSLSPTSSASRKGRVRMPQNPPPSVRHTPLQEA